MHRANRQRQEHATVSPNRWKHPTISAHSHTHQPHHIKPDLSCITPCLTSSPFCPSSRAWNLHWDEGGVQKYPTTMFNHNALRRLSLVALMVPDMSSCCCNEIDFRLLSGYRTFSFKVTLKIGISNCMTAASSD
jgi:hypothetical protein